MGGGGWGFFGGGGVEGRERKAVELLAEIIQPFQRQNFFSPKYIGPLLQKQEFEGAKNEKRFNAYTK